MNGLTFSILIVLVLLHLSLKSYGISIETSLHFKSLSYPTRIYESASTDVQIAKLEAYYYPMNSSFQKIEYKMVPFDDFAYFKVDSSGKLSTKKIIDRNVGQKYNITVLALSMSYNNKIINISKPLSIIVSEFNEHEPQFSCSKYNVVIHYSSPIGYKKVEVKAIDRDHIDYNSNIIYSIISNPNTYLPFTINSTSGELIITDRIPFNPKSYSIEIKAEDTGSPMRYNTAIVHIDIDFSISAPLIASISLHQKIANICWSMSLNESINGYLVVYKGEYETKPTTINITTDNNKFECFILYEIEPNVNYSLQIYAWNKRGIGLGSVVQYFFSHKNCDCGVNNLCKPNLNGVCICPHGILGPKCEIPSPCPCSNNGTCNSTIYHNFNSIPNCICRHGFEGNLCQQKVKCKNEITITSKGLFNWNSSQFGESISIHCPHNNNSYATRLCLLMANGSAIWDDINDKLCYEQIVFASRSERLESIDLRLASKTKTNAESILKTIDDIIAIDERDDYFEDTNEKISTIVDKILSVVPLSSGEEFVVQHKNIAAKVMDISKANKVNGISFHPNFEKPSNLATPIQPSIKLPSEAFIKALEKSDLNEVRVQIVAYITQKLFKVSQNEIIQKEMPVIQATVGNLTINKLNEPVIVILQCFQCNFTDYPFAKCVFWNENNRKWSTEGIKTQINANNKSIICSSSHLTAFSVLFDLTPDENRSQNVILSTITYIGCYLSISGLFLTLITYSLFRCLNRDNSGKILLHLCISLIALNVSFIIGSQKSIFGLNDSCALMAILIHYFVFTSLSWMCVEAIHIYQLLIHVFATAETHYMLKRTTISWGLPFIWVFITVCIQSDAYYNRDEYCMISPKFAEVYYISYLMPASVLIIVNFAVFVLATKVLFTPRLAATTSKRSQSHSPISLSQIRGAFTVMTLLGIGWIFGALAIGKMRLTFQYIFSLSNSLQGFFIFMVRCLQYPEARNAWIQLLKSGTFKKQRGQPQRSWFANSGSNRLSGSDRKQSKETDSSLTMTANRNSDLSTKMSKPFLPSDDNYDIKHFTSYDSIKVSVSSQTAIEKKINAYD